jgi:hypothetical protein
MEELIPIVMFLCIAGVAILRPITKPLGRLLDAMAQERLAARSGGQSDDTRMERVATLLEVLNDRLDLLDERVQFVERLSDGRSRSRIGVIE